VERGVRAARPVRYALCDMRFPWTRRKPPLGLRVARTLERHGVPIEGLAVETSRGRITLRGTVADPVTRERAVEVARAVEDVRRVDDRLGIVSKKSPSEKGRTPEDCTGIYVTQPGDSLPKIAELVLGTRVRWLELLALNRRVVRDHGVLPPGLRLRLPPS
jgi:hypothetical protein